MILVTGGAGYIGSHTCVELLENGYEVVVLDNLTNAHAVALERVRQITGKPLSFHECDMRDGASLASLFQKYPIEAVIHLAGLKALGESIEKPLAYYENNVGGAIALLRAMASAGAKTLVFSSSATVYGARNPSPYTEDMPISHSPSPYGQTKIIIENMLRDVYRANADWRISILRYFNPVGAHASGLIGEEPSGVPCNLCPYIAQVAAGRREALRVWGNDYPTPDGTGLRDYIHVVDLARGHLAALEKLKVSPGLDVYNLGTGRGNSVLEVLRAFEKASGQPIPYSIEPRRAGDLAVAVANVEKARRELNWEAKYSLERMAEDAWRWQVKNPNGYMG